MATTSDTTWNLTEYSNEAKAAFVAQRETHNVGITVQLGSAVEANRRPVWEMVNSESGMVNRDARFLESNQRFQEKLLLVK